MWIVISIEKNVWNSLQFGIKNCFVFRSLVTKYIDEKVQGLYYATGNDATYLKSIFARDSIPYSERVISYNENAKLFCQYDGNYVNCRTVL